MTSSNALWQLEAIPVTNQTQSREMNADDELQVNSQSSYALGSFLNVNSESMERSGTIYSNACESMKINEAKVGYEVLAMHVAPLDTNSMNALQPYNELEEPADFKAIFDSIGPDFLRGLGDAIDPNPNASTVSRPTVPMPFTA